MTPSATLRVRAPMHVHEPRGAIAAAALMIKLLRMIASLAAGVAGRAR